MLKKAAFAALAIVWCAGAAAAESAAGSPAAGSPTAAEAPGGSSIAPLWTVHIDEVRPEKAAEFERLNIAENKGVHAVLREHEQPITPVYELVMTGSVYMSMRPKLSFAELDGPSAVPEEVAKLLSAVTDPLDEPIHAALKFHHNEIWRYRPAGSYIPAAPGYTLPAPGYIQIVSERVVPGMEEKYSALADAQNAALKKSGYPWSVLLFTSSYGDGAYKYLWQADSKAAFLKAGDRAAVLTAALGKEAAGRMLDDLKRCLAGTETAEATARRDFTDLPDSAPWPGLPPRAALPGPAAAPDDTDAPEQVAASGGVAAAR